MSEPKAEELMVRFEELSDLEADFEDVELEIIRKTNALRAPLYAKRAELIAQIPHFWALVFDQSPHEVSAFIQPSDARVFEDALQTLEVTHFELDDPNGSPRSVAIKFGFKENDAFEDKTVEKIFWYRKSLDGWEGYVSEPVKINWKKGKDLTGGLTDAAHKLFEAKKKTTDAKTAQNLPEYKALVKMIEDDTEAANSFFAWFGFVSSYKWVTAEESVEATKKEKEEREKKKRSENVEEEEPDEDEQDHQETEVFPQGDVIATLIAEDMWPSAIKYFKQAHEAEDDLSELDMEELDDDESDMEIDIRGLVGKGKNAPGGSPPTKKQRKA